MNIFVTSTCPRECARNLDDKRVGKLLMEANQMLSLAVKHSIDNWQQHVGPGKLVAGMAYNNHPCSIWVRESLANFEWLLKHAHALSEEFTHRFGKKHASYWRSRYITEHFYCANPLVELTPFANCASNQSLGVSFRHMKDVPTAYREYLKFRWANDTMSVNFTNREVPSWA